MLAWIARTASASSLPPQFQPPMAQAPKTTAGISRLLWPSRRRIMERGAASAAPEDRQPVRDVERAARRSDAEAQARVAVVDLAVARRALLDRVAQQRRARGDRELAGLRRAQRAADGVAHVEALQHAAR